MLTAMARELVTEKGIGEAAAVVWRQIQVQAEHANIVPTTIIKPEVAVIEDVPLTTPLVTQVLTVPAVANALKFGSRPPSARPARRSGGLPDGAQFSLF